MIEMLSFLINFVFEFFRYLIYSKYLICAIDTTVLSDIQDAFTTIIQVTIYAFALYLVFIPLRGIRR